MKTAISIDDKVFNEAELAASVLGMSRSLLYTQAVKEYILRHLPEKITENYDRVYAEINEEDEEFSRIAIDVLSRVEWE